MTFQTQADRIRTYRQVFETAAGRLVLQDLLEHSFLLGPPEEFKYDQSDRVARDRAILRAFGTDILVNMGIWTEGQEKTIVDALVGITPLPMNEEVRRHQDGKTQR